MQYFLLILNSFSISYKYIVKYNDVQGMFINKRKKYLQTHKSDITK